MSSVNDEEHMASILKNPLLDKKLRAEGFVKVQVLNRAQVVECAQLYAEFSDHAPTSGFHTSNWIKNQDYRNAVHNRIGDVVHESLRGLFNEYRCIYRYFLVKLPRPDSEFKLHQDWSLVDESQWTGATVWIPLVDTNLRNGAFQVVPRSHRFGTGIRGRNIKAPYLEIRDELEKQYCIPVNCKAGEAIIFDHRLMHFSAPNMTDLPRVAIGATFVPNNAALVRYWKNEAGEVMCANVPDDFLIIDHMDEQELDRLIRGKGQEMTSERTIGLKDFHKMFVKENGWSTHRFKHLLARFGILNH